MDTASKREASGRHEFDGTADAETHFAESDDVLSDHFAVFISSLSIIAVI